MLFACYILNYLLNCVIANIGQIFIFYIYWNEILTIYLLVIFIRYFIHRNPFILLAALKGYRRRYRIIVRINFDWKRKNGVEGISVQSDNVLNLVVNACW